MTSVAPGQLLILLPGKTAIFNAIWAEDVERVITIIKIKSAVISEHLMCVRNKETDSETPQETPLINGRAGIRTQDLHLASHRCLPRRLQAGVPGCFCSSRGGGGLRRPFKQAIQSEFQTGFRSSAPGTHLCKKTASKYRLPCAQSETLSQFRGSQMFGKNAIFNLQPTQDDYEQRDYQNPSHLNNTRRD